MKSNLYFFKEFFMILGGILIGFGLKELILLFPFTAIDKIVLFISGGIILMLSGQDLLNRNFREFFKSLFYFISALLIVVLVRIFLLKDFSLF